MPFLIYLAIALVTVFSVIIEMDALVEPTRHIERAAIQAQQSLPPTLPAGALRSQAKRPAPPQVKKADTNPPTVLAKPATAKVVDTPPASIMQDAAAANASVPPIAEKEPQPKCDVAACESAYFTFAASDCTYQPSNGPRRLCTKGTPPGTSASAAPNASATAAQASAQCNQNACTQSYISFNPADCTYQPSQGPRRLCTK
jgi:BA14K-like protein